MVHSASALSRSSKNRMEHSSVLRRMCMMRIRSCSESAISYQLTPTARRSLMLWWETVPGVTAAHVLPLLPLWGSHQLWRFRFEKVRQTVRCGKRCVVLSRLHSELVNRLRFRQVVRRLFFARWPLHTWPAKSAVRLLRALLCMRQVRLPRMSPCAIRRQLVEARCSNGLASSCTTHRGRSP